MAQAFTIPTYFTAIDKFSSPVMKMGSTLEGFAFKAEATVNRAERTFRRLTPAIGEASKQMLSMVGTAAVVGAAFAGAAFSGKAIMDFETEIANLSAITGTSGKQLEVFKSKIKEVAIATRESSIEVAKAFTLIGNNSPQLLQDAVGLSEVAKQSIILAQASKMELAPAAEALTTIMNQFNIPSKEAKGAIDLLAGGMVIGSTNIDAVADAMTRFGGVASQVAGVSMAESVTAIEAISDKMKDAEKIGTQFRNIFLIMSNIKGQDPKALKDLNAMGVNMDIVASKTEPLINKLNELKKLTGRAGALEHVFSKENIQSLIPLLNSTEKYSDMLKKLTTSEDSKNAAQKMADKNNATLSKSIEFLKNKWVTMITTSDNATSGLYYFNRIVQFLTRNLDTIVTVTGVLIGVFAIWWALIKVARVWLFLYNVVFGVYMALTKTAIIYTAEQTVAMTAQRVATGLMTGSQWLLNAAMLASPYLLMAAGIAALLYSLYELYNMNDKLKEQYSSGINQRVSNARKEEISDVEKLASSIQKKRGITKEQALSFALKAEMSNVQANIDNLNAKLKDTKDEGKILALSQDLTQEMARKSVLSDKNVFPIDLKSQRSEKYSEQTINKKETMKFDFVNMPKWMKVAMGDNDLGTNIEPSMSSTMPIWGTK